MSKWKHILYIVGTANLCTFIYLVINNKNGQFYTLLAALISLLGTRMEDISKLSLSKDGLKAEMQQVIKEAKATINQLHLLAEEFTRFTLESMQAEGRWGSGFREKEKTKEKMLLMLKELGVDERKIKNIESVEHPYICFDYAGYVVKDLGRGLAEEQR